MTKYPACPITMVPRSSQLLLTFALRVTRADLREYLPYEATHVYYRRPITGLPCSCSLLIWRIVIIFLPRMPSSFSPMNASYSLKY